MDAQEYISAEEWRIKYEVVVRHITNPAVIENAERAARIVRDLATSGIYSLPVCTELMLQFIHAFYVQDQPPVRDSTALTEALRRGAPDGATVQRALGEG